METVQYNKYQDAWNTEEIIEPTKEIMVYGLTVNSKFATYETWDKHQMFMFKHDATEQTSEQIDYRYIGDDPYNYVFFNCDNINNQSSSTCEVWRIIGVFDVERKIEDNDNPGQNITVKEQRMKLVRGNVLASDMKWNTNFENDWTTSTLKTFLNDSYLNRTGSASSNGLKASARGMIEEAKYYLGSLSLHPTKWIFGTTEKIYGEERGNVVCGACHGDNTKLTWQGNVGLMYPSDEYMVYAGGVNDTCYTDPTTCHEINAQTGWIFNSNIKQGESSKDYIWLLSPRGDNNSARELFVSSDGYLFDYRSVNDGVYGVRPVVYLSADVKIIDGDGSSGNPYKLKK